MWAYFANKEWSIYPFIPPLLSLIVSLFVSPIYDALFGSSLRDFLAERKMEKSYVIVNGIAKDRSLQSAYLTGAISFFSSIITTLKSDHPIVLTAILLPFFVLILVLFLKIFMRKPGYLATTVLPNRGWTYSSFYSNILLIFNSILIFIIIFALPARKNP